MTELRCEVCGDPAIGVACSPLGPISHAYCRVCAQLGREPWSTLVGALLGCSNKEVAAWIRPAIEATCTFYGKTEEQLWEEVDAAYKSFCSYMDDMQKQEEYCADCWALKKYADPEDNCPATNGEHNFVKDEED